LGRRYECTFGVSKFNKLEEGNYHRHGNASTAKEAVRKKAYSAGGEKGKTDIGKLQSSDAI